MSNGDEIDDDGGGKPRAVCKAGDAIVSNGSNGSNDERMNEAHPDVNILLRQISKKPKPTKKAGKVNNRISDLTESSNRWSVKISLGNQARNVERNITMKQETRLKTSEAMPNVALKMCECDLDADTKATLSSIVKRYEKQLKELDVQILELQRLASNLQREEKEIFGVGVNTDGEDNALDGSAQINPGTDEVDTNSVDDEGNMLRMSNDDKIDDDGDGKPRAVSKAGDAIASNDSGSNDERKNEALPEDNPFLQLFARGSISSLASNDIDQALFSRPASISSLASSGTTGRALDRSISSDRSNGGFQYHLLRYLNDEDFQYFGELDNLEPILIDFNDIVPQRIENEIIWNQFYEKGWLS
jgi:hypothetical protein